MCFLCHIPCRRCRFRCEQRGPRRLGHNLRQFRRGGNRRRHIFASSGYLERSASAVERPTRFPATGSPPVILVNGTNLPSIPVVAPAVFQMSPQHQGAIENASYRLVSAANPVSSGKVILIYCTGLGPVTVPQVDGVAASGSALASTTFPVTATIGGLPAPVLWSGLTPGSVGLYQVNATVPMGVPVGALLSS